MNRFPPNLGCGCFSSCSTDTWYSKHSNPKKVFCDVIASVLYFKICTLDLFIDANYLSSVNTNLMVNYDGTLQKFPHFHEKYKMGLFCSFTLHMDIAVFCQISPELWKKLPLHIKNHGTLNQFKSSLKLT